MKLSREEVEALRKTKDFGHKAEAVLDVIGAVCDSIIERCKTEFSTTPIINYQNIDNNRIFVLQFEMKMARDFKAAVEKAIYDGQDAAKNLQEAE